MPAKAGIQNAIDWVPAFAGTSGSWVSYGRSMAALAFWISAGDSENASLTMRSTASPVCQVSVSSLSFLACAI